MITAVDSSVLFDVVKGAPQANASMVALTSAAERGVLCVSAPVVAELGRYFDDRAQMQDFFGDSQIEYSAISLDSAFAAALIMNQYARNKGPRNRVSADFLIGAHALVQADCLLTRDSGFFRDYFKGLKVINPAKM